MKQFKNWEDFFENSGVCKESVVTNLNVRLGAIYEWVRNNYVPKKRFGAIIKNTPMDLSIEDLLRLNTRVVRMYRAEQRAGIRTTKRRG